MHGLVFETSICYWQDQPDSRFHGRTPASGPVSFLIGRSRRGSSQDRTGVRTGGRLQPPVPTSLARPAATTRTGGISTALKLTGPEFDIARPASRFSEARRLFQGIGMLVAVPNRSRSGGISTLHTHGRYTRLLTLDLEHIAAIATSPKLARTAGDGSCPPPEFAYDTGMASSHGPTRVFLGCQTRPCPIHIF